MREERRLDTAEDQPVVPEQLLTGGGKPGRQIVLLIDVDRVELLVRGPLQHDEPYVVVLGDGTAQELDLEPRLALEVEDPRTCILHYHQPFELVVGDHGLAVTCRDPEPQPAGARLLSREVHPHGCHVTVAGQVERSAREDLFGVLHDELCLTAAEA